MNTIIRYLISGAINTVLGILIIYGLMFFLKINPYLSNFLGYSIGFFLGYILNKNWVFIKNNKRKFIFLKYLFIILFSYLINIAIVSAAITIIGANPYISQIFGATTYTLVSYILIKKLFSGNST